KRQPIAKQCVLSNTLSNTPNFHMSFAFKPTQVAISQSLILPQLSVSSCQLDVFWRGVVDAFFSIPELENFSRG
ncbi:hypothetical protein, partial [Vibrio cholerae]|uniref:hypothetical protein n=1 Tax=Vibrio cholerae TaxID=666 RepID=UPI001F1FAE04